MTENAQNADLRRKPQIFADSPLLLEIPAFGGRRKPQKTADFRRKPKIFAENRRKPQIGLCHLRCVTFSSAFLGRKDSEKGCEGFDRHKPRGPDPRVRLALPPSGVDLASKEGQIRKSMSNRCRIDAKRGRRGGFEGEVREVCA